MVMGKEKDVNAPSVCLCLYQMGTRQPSPCGFSRRKKFYPQLAPLQNHEISGPERLKKHLVNYLPNQKPYIHLWFIRCSQVLDKEHSEGESTWEICNLGPSERIREPMASQGSGRSTEKKPGFTGKLNSVKVCVSQTLTTEPFHSHRKSINGTINLQKHEPICPSFLLILGLKD